MKNIVLFALSFTFLLSINSCYKEKFETSGDALLTFSRDTMVFDTVFTTQGSATRILKVYNEADLPIIISKIYLEEDNGAHFRFNFDGISGTEVTEVEVPAKDSIYIFGEVTIDPNAPISNSPFIVEGKLKFQTNGKEQFVQLEAWGQNANYVTPNTLYGGQYYYSCDMGDWNWDDPEGKPYIINGVLLVDSCTINIPPGTDVYVHGGIINTVEGSYNEGLLFFLKDGHINTNGTVDEPVTFQTARLEYAYDDISGQWSGIRIGATSRNNSINHTIIKNAVIGLRVDSAAQVTIDNSIFAHMTNSGVAGIQAEIDLNNSLIYDTGNYGFLAIYGGKYNLNYSTINSNGTQTGALSLSNALCLNQFCTEFYTKNLTTNIKNCILTGSQQDAISLFNPGGDPLNFNYSIKNTIISETELHMDSNFSDFYSKCTDCINLESTHKLFIDKDGYNFHLDTLSIAEKNALPLNDFLLDIEGNNRDGSVPDVGCYEYQY